MKRFYSLTLVILASAAVAFNPRCFAQTVTFSYSVAAQTYTVPAGCTLISIDMAGGQGGQSPYSNTAGYGGRVQCNMNVSPGQVLNVYVAAQGGNYIGCCGSGAVCPGNGSGYVGGNGGWYGGAGGGCSEIRVSPYGPTNRVVVAGGGGGGGYDCTSDHGGLGGGLTGGNGLDCGSYDCWVGGGGTQAAGGASPSCYGTGLQGSYGSGGNAVNGSYGWNGGGGAGYYGGGGSYQFGGGGGGSSYTDPTTVVSGTVVHTQGYNSAGNGYVKITPIVPNATATPTSLAFGSVVVGSVSPVQSFSVTSTLINLPSPLTITAPSGFGVSMSPTGPFNPTASLTYTTTSIPTTPVYVQFQPIAYAAITASVAITGGGLPVATNVTVSGTGTFPCTGTPSIGTAAVSPASGNAGTAFTLSIPPVTSGGGITYQWQSYNVLSGSYFTNIPGATTASYGFTGISATTYFRCIVTCMGSGSSVTSNIVTATLSSGTACSGLPVAGTVSADVISGCAPSYSANLYYTTTDASTGLVYQWQRSTTGPSSGFSPIAGATNPYYVATVTGTVWYNMFVTCTNSFGSSSSSSMQETFNALPTPISGVSNICSATPATFTSTPTGGTWTSSNPSVANAGLGTGVITAVSPGFATITYTAPTGCTAVEAVSVNTSPATISGSTSVCSGSTITLSDISSGGAWSSSNISVALISSSTGAVTGGSAGTAMVTYTLPNGCTAVTPITTNPLPNPISGASNVCVGGTTTLSDATAGGMWKSSNPFIASVDPVSGAVVGMAAGTPSIMYFLPTGCQVTSPMTVNALPAPISGSSSVCVGSTVTLSESTTGTWSASPASVASANAATGDITGIIAGAASVQFTDATTGCSITAPMTVNGIPIVENVTGGGGYCPGGTGVHVGLSGSESGVSYTLSGTSGPVLTMPGTSSGIDFGVYTTADTYTVSATNTTTGCTDNMSGVANVFINTPPNVYTMGGGGSYCSGGAGKLITLSGSDVGVSYQLYNGGPIGSPVAGTGSVLPMGTYTVSGFYTAVATDVATGCSSNMLGTSHIIISPAPTVDTVGGSGGYCVGTAGDTIKLSNSTPGIDYYLIYAGSNVDTVAGTGLPLAFPPQTVTGTYTVMANDITNNCSSNMYGSATVWMNPPPNIHNMTGGGNYCMGGTGVPVGLDFSDIGTQYQLYNGSAPVPGSLVFGSNSSINFGFITAAGTYTVLATVTATGCTANMNGSATVNSVMPPNAYTVSAPSGSSYCAGGAGVEIQLPNSDAGTNYQLYRNGIPVGPMVLGSSTGSSISFGFQTAPGNYTVGAVNPTTTCSAMMAGSVTVTINPLPTAYNVGGGGNYCYGGSGVPVTLSNSTSGVNYIMTIPGGATYTVTGGGGPATFGLQTAPGVYTVMASDPTTGCVRNMNGSASINVLPLPAAYAVTGGGGYCAGGTGVHIGLAVSNAGITYQLQNSSGTVGTLRGTGSSLDFGLFSTPDTYSIIATNDITTCANTMTGSVTVSVNPLPGVFTVLGGGQFCAGGTGVHDSLSSSEIGVTYQQYIGSTLVGGSFTGTGSSIDFGLQTVAGTYTVKATNTGTGCASMMAASAVVTVNPVPVVYTVSGGGSFCAGGVGVHINLSGSDLGGVQYQIWRNGTIPEGSFWAGTGRPLDLGAHTNAGVYTIVATDPVTMCSSTMTDSATINVIPNVVPTVNLSLSSGHGDSVCHASATIFTALGTNGGSTPVYIWKVNGATMATGSTYSYVPNNNDNVTVSLVSSALCPSPDTVSNTHIITSVDPVTPSLSISSGSGTVICPGTSVTFTAAPVNGGAAPSYSWKVNGVAVASSGSSYSYRPNDSDVVFATMNSDYFCVSSTFALSNPIAMHINAPIFPVFTLETNPGTTVGIGRNVIFVANVDNAGATAPTYQWKLNSANISGATNPTYNTNTLARNDVVCVAVTGHNSCGASAPAEHCETMDVVDLAVQQVVGDDVRVMPNPNKGIFSVKGSVSSAQDADVTLEVTNMLGQVIYHNTVRAHNGTLDAQIQLSGSLANGMYLLNVGTGSDSKVFHFVVEQ